MRHIGPLRLPMPVTSWNGLDVVTGEPLVYDSHEWRIGARLLVPRLLGGLSLADLAVTLGSGGGLSLQATCDDGRPKPLGFVDLAPPTINPEA